MIVFQKDYDGESLYDLDRNVSESIMEEYNPVVADIPVDENGIQLGTFKVTIEWVADEE